MHQHRSPRTGLAQAMRVLDLGLRVVITSALGAALGYWGDRSLEVTGRFPLLTLLGLLLGLCLGFVALARGLAEEDERVRRERERDDAE